MYLGLDPQNRPVYVHADDLTTHGVVLGRSGSGKTGLTIAIVEEMLSAGIHAIVFDLKGDLANLALRLSTEQQFASWVENGQSPRAEYRRHMQGLSRFGHSAKNVKTFEAQVDISIFAPGRAFGGGRTLNVFPTFAPPAYINAGSLRDQAGRSVASVLQALKEKTDPYDPALVYITEAVVQAWSEHRSLPIDVWPGILSCPPPNLQSFGGMALEEFFTKRARTDLARMLIGFQHQSDRWLNGETLDLHKLVAQPRPQLAIFSMRHLSEEERLFFTSVMMQRLVEFMYETTASKGTKLLVVLDEARGYLPSHPANPPTKQPICTILAQGRAQGLGILIGTQNPMDLDYRALSNVGTWFIGRLRERDCARDLVSELNSRGVDLSTLEKMAPRRFLVLDKNGNHHMLHTRWCFSYLRGPMDNAELAKLEQLGMVMPSVPVGRLIRPAPPTSEVIKDSMAGVADKIQSAAKAGALSVASSLGEVISDAKDSLLKPSDQPRQPIKGSIKVIYYRR